MNARRLGGLSPEAILLVWVTLFASGGGGALTVVFNLYLLNAGASEALLGALAGAAAASAALAALPAGWLSDRIGRRDLLLLAGAAGGAAQLAQILWPVPAVLLPAAWVGGVATVSLGVVVAPLIAEHTSPAERQKAFSVVAAAGLVGGVAGNLLGGWLPAHWAAMGALAADRDTLLAATGVQLLALPGVLGLRNDRRRPAPRAAGPLLGRVPAALPRLLLPEALIGLGAGLFIPFYNVFLARRLHAGTAAIGLIFSVQALVTAGVTLLGPAVARRLGRVRGIVTLQVSSLPLLLTMALAPSLAVVAGAGWARAGLMNASVPLLSALAMDALAAEQRAIGNAALGMATNGGVAAGAWAGGYLMQRDLSLPYFFTFGLYLAAAYAIHRLLKPLDAPAESG